MRRSFRIAKIFGIPVQVHWSFALLFLFVIYVGKSRDASWTNIAVFGLFIIALFVCVLLHEFGHALSARYYGVQTRDITILPIGGVARLDNLPEKPIQEFVVALAGPVVNVGIYGVLAAFLYLKYSLRLPFTELLTNDSSELIVDPVIGFWATLMQANLMLVVFNMIPAFPMDGGRVLRALLSMPLGRLQATKIAVILGQIIAICFLFYGLSPAVVRMLPETGFYAQLHEWVDWGFQPVLTLISGFVFYSARTEYKQVRFEEKLNDVNVSEIIRTEYTPLKTSDPLNTVIQILAKGHETNFLVFDDTDILRGVLHEDDILDAMKNRHYDAMVSSYTIFNTEKISSTATLKEVYDKMYRANNMILPVFKLHTEGGNKMDILGVVDAITLEKFIHKEEKILNFGLF